jgi:hypothetical protein
LRIRRNLEAEGWSRAKVELSGEASALAPSGIPRTDRRDHEARFDMVAVSGASAPVERRAQGKRQRDAAPRDAHAAWRPPAHRADPIGILRAADAARQRQLVHLDETLPAPWEWDLKRLVASFALAARANGLSVADGRDAATACARSYRRKTRDFAGMDVLDVWYARLDDSDFLAMLPQGRKGVLRRRIAKATAAGSSELVFPKLVEQAGKSAYAQHGERVVQGQRLMQSASDLFLGWATGAEGRHFYVRQLRDVKLSPLVETYDAEMLSIYGEACGWVLARAHAKAGDPWAISGYLGKGGRFDDAMGEFALAYADQAERDHAALKAAVGAGIVEAQVER